jgi:CNT family concentrative nucleoside transporter
MDGIPVLVGILAVLLVSIACVTLVNDALGLLPVPGLSLQGMLALPFRPLMWSLGIDWAEAGTAAELMATKTILNEFVAYLRLAALPAEALSAHARLVMTYALCGFANLGSLGILLGGLTSMVPQRRAEIVALAPRTLVAGTLATLSCGSLVSAIL